MISGIILALMVLGFCLVFYRLRCEKFSGFLGYLGIYGASSKSVLYATLIAILALACSLIIFAYFGLQHLVLNPDTPAGSLRSNGFNLAEISKIIVFAWIGTALWEELFFRGFLAKRLINSFGFFMGNTTHSVLFGLMHVSAYRILKLPIGTNAYILIAIIPSLLAYSTAYLNEQVAKGSILPSYVAHAMLNTLTPIAAVTFF